MMLSKITLGLFLMMSVTLPSGADVFKLKNGNTMEGAVQEETETAYIIDVGFGAIHLPKSDVTSVEKKSFSYAPETPQVTQKAQAGTGRQNLEGDRMPVNEKEWELYDLLKKLERGRGTARRYARQRDLAAKSIEKYEKERDSLEKKQIKLQKKYLTEKAKKSVTYHNQIVYKDNEYKAKMNGKTSKIKQARDNIEKYEQKIQEFHNSLAELTGLYSDLKSSAGKDRTWFYNDVAKRLEVLRGDIVEKEIESVSDSQSHVYVEAMLNSRVKAILMVDTGATAVSLSPGIVTKLGIIEDQIIHEGYSTVADGRKVPYKSFVLDSISVGEFELGNFVVSYSPDRKEGAFQDGLLGMDFLKHFDFTVDASNKKLILRKLKGSNR